jgi:Tudor domain
LLNLIGSGKPVRVADQLLVATSAQVPLPAECALNVMETAYVSAVVGDGEFFVQLSNVDVDALEQFGTRINEYYSKNTVQALSRPQPGDFCCCQYITDELFYRAIVVREFAGKYLVSIKSF